MKKQLIRNDYSYFTEANKNNLSSKLVRLYSHTKMRLHTLFVAQKTHSPLFVFSTPRTGSGLLLSYLASNNQMDNYGELFNEYRSDSYINMDNKKAHFLIKYYSSFYRKKGMIKVHLEHLKNKKIDIKTLLTPYKKSKIIILYRKNILAQYVSFQMAILTGQWQIPKNNSKEYKAASKNTIFVNLEDFMVFRDEKIALYKNCLSAMSNRPILVLSYEELADSPEETFSKKIVPFLDIHNFNIQATIKKQNKQLLSESIENYAEIHTLLDEKYFTIDLTDLDTDAYSQNAASL